jgi:hypothetical protein
MPETPTPAQDLAALDRVTELAARFDLATAELTGILACLRAAVATERHLTDSLGRAFIDAGGPVGRGWPRDLGTTIIRAVASVGAEIVWPSPEPSDSPEVATVDATAPEAVASASEGAPLPLDLFSEWLRAGERGLSSYAIVGALTGQDFLPGQPITVSSSYPLDAGDFWRCEKLLRAVPGSREHLSVMADVSPEWAALVSHWDELVELEVGALTRRIWDLVSSPTGEDRP